MHQILFQLGALPQTPLGRLQRSPRTPGWKGPTSKGDRRKEREKEGRGLRKGRGEREGKKCTVPPPTFECT